MKRKALLIGINKYHLLGDLKYARQDAEAFGNALKFHCGFSDLDVKVMTCVSEGAMKGLSQYVEYAITDLTGERDLDLLVFGFWGHGFAPEPGKRYLCGVDTVTADIERTAVSMDVVRAKLAQAGALNTLLVLDCCQNKPLGRGAATDSLTRGEEASLSEMARDIQAAKRNVGPRDVPTVAVLNACREGQRAFEWDERGHGVFTAHLLDGLAKSFFGVVQLSSWLFDRVRQTTYDLHREEQTPFVCLEGRGDISLKAVHGPLDAAAVSSPRPRRPIPTVAPYNPGAQWWAVVDDRECGPLSEDELNDLIRTSKLTRSGQVWREGAAKWMVAGDVGVLRGLFGPAPAGPPVRPASTTGTERTWLPDYLEVVEDAQYAPLFGSAKGSRNAQEGQRKCVERGHPLEVRSRRTGMLFRLIPPGRFIMGSPANDDLRSSEEDPAREVRITREFWMGRHPVTQAQWAEVMSHNPSVFAGETRPVEGVSWEACQSFLKRLNDGCGGRFRLPTEAEWEYACRGGRAARYVVGDDVGSLRSVAWYGANSRRHTCPVGGRKPNAYGLYDMHGNVWEWCQDWLGSYRSGSERDPLGVPSGVSRVIRGGSWNSGAAECRSASRRGSPPALSGSDTGVRLVWTEG